MRLPIRAKMILCIGLPTAAIYVAAIFWMLSYARGQTMRMNERSMIDLAETSAARFDEYISKAARVADTTARFISRAPGVTEPQIYGMLGDTVRLNQRVYGAAMAFEPGTFRTDDSLFCPYVFEDRSRPGEVRTMNIDRDTLDWYADPQWEWWRRAKEEDQGIWTRPYFDEGAGNIMMITYSAPFYGRRDRSSPAFRGVTTVDIDLETLEAEIRATIGAADGFYILASDGSFVVAPNEADVMSTTIFEIHERQGRPDLDPVARDILDEPTSQVCVTEFLGQDGALVASARIPSTDWVLVTTRNAHDAMLDFRERTTRVLIGSLLALSLILGSILFVSGRLTRPIGRLRERVLAIADGRQECRVDDLRTGDEIEELAGAFSTMQGKVADREEQLESARERTLAELLESAPDAMLVADPAGIIRRCNAKASALFGYARHELVTMDVTMLMPERYREEHGEHMVRYFGDPSARDMGAGLELLGAKKDGSEFPVEIGLSPFHEPEGVMAVAAIRDITERRRAETELRKLNQAVEQGSAIVFITDPDGTIEYVNPRFSEVTGYTPEEAIGQTPRLLNSGRQTPSVYEEVWSSLTSGREWRGEFCNRKKDGTLFWASAALAPIRDARGNITHFVAIEDDITAARAAAEDIKNEEERFRTLVANLPGTVYRCLHDPERTMVFISEDVENLTGHPDRDFLHNNVQSFESVIHPDDRARVADAIAAAVEAHLPWAVEYRLRHADGTMHWIGDRGRGIYNTNGDAAYLDGVMADITDRKRLEAEIVDARRQAEAANHAKSDFLSHMSHELRTPLNGVLGYAQILQRDRDATANQKESLNAIVNCGTHLLALINDVLDLSKIEAGHLEIDAAPCNLSRLVKSVSDVVVQRAVAKGLRFDTNVSAEVPQGIVTDAAKLRQILVNLLGNAVKFTSEGRVALDVAESPKGRLRFRVIDSGIGMTKEELADIFDPFKQVEAGKAAGGTGLGLAITQRLVEALSGTISVESATGRGSTFSVDLPLVETRTDDFSAIEADGALDFDDAVLAPDQSCTVLVADDRDANRDILDRMLSAMGIHALLADDGDTALEMIRAHDTIDLVLMDVRMPRLNGIEAVKAIRLDPALRDLKVIAVTASVFPQFKEKAIEAGFDDFLGKPFRTEELVQKLRKHLTVEFVESTPHETASPSEDEAPDAALSTADADRIAARILDALQLGNITALQALAGELAAEPSTASWGRRIGALSRAFDFAGLERIAHELENK